MAKKGTTGPAVRPPGSPAPQKAKDIVRTSVKRVRHRPEEDEVEEKGILEWKGRESGGEEKGSLLFFLQTNHRAPGVLNSGSCSQM